MAVSALQFRHGGISDWCGLLLSTLQSSLLAPVAVSVAYRWSCPHAAADLTERAVVASQSTSLVNGPDSRGFVEAVAVRQMRTFPQRVSSRIGGKQVPSHINNTPSSLCGSLPTKPLVASYLITAADARFSCRQGSPPHLPELIVLVVKVAVLQLVSSVPKVYM